MNIQYVILFVVILVFLVYLYNDTEKFIPLKYYTLTIGNEVYKLINNPGIKGIRDKNVRGNPHPIQLRYTGGPGYKNYGNSLMVHIDKHKMLLPEGHYALEFLPTVGSQVGTIIAIFNLDKDVILDNILILACDLYNLKNEIGNISHYKPCNLTVEKGLSMWIDQSCGKTTRGRPIFVE